MWPARCLLSFEPLLQERRRDLPPAEEAWSFSGLEQSLFHHGPSKSGVTHVPYSAIQRVDGVLRMKPSQKDDLNHPNELIYETVQITAAAVQRETNMKLWCDVSTYTTYTRWVEMISHSQRPCFQ